MFKRCLVFSPSLFFFLRMPAVHCVEEKHLQIPPLLQLESLCSAHAVHQV